MQISVRDGKPFIKNGSPRWTRPVIFGNKFFPSVTSFAEKNGIEYSSAVKSATEEMELDGKEVRYATLSEIKDRLKSPITINSKPSKKPSKKPQRRHGPVVVDGIVYESQTAYCRSVERSSWCLRGMWKNGTIRLATKKDLEKANPVEGQNDDQAEEVSVKFVFEGVVWDDGSVTVRLPRTPFSMTRKNIVEIPKEIAEQCLWK